MSRYSEDYLSQLPPMYNEDLKKRYIEERESEVMLGANYLNCQFHKIAEYENELEKDCSNFSKAQIIEYFKLQNSTSFEGLQCLNSQLSLYTQFCLQQNLVFDCQNHYLELNGNDIKGCLNKALLQMKFVTREIVYKWCNELPNPRDQFVLLCLYSGIKGKDFSEIMNMKREDINGNIVTLCTGRKVALSDKLTVVIEECIMEDKYYSISGNGSKTMPLVDNGFIFKDYPNAKMDVSVFQRGRVAYNNISRVLSFFGVVDIMSANSITESGKLEMIKELAKDHNMNCKELIYSPYIQLVEEKYNCNIVKSVFVTKYQDVFSA